jgi:DNA-binding protein HU-beta
MNKMEFIAAMAAELGATKSDASKIVGGFMNVIKNSLTDGEEIRLIGFGSFKVVDVAAKEVRNPQTKAKIMVPATKRIKFVAGKELKESVNHKKKK